MNSLLIFVYLLYADISVVCRYTRCPFSGMLERLPNTAHYPQLVSQVVQVWRRQHLLDLQPLFFFSSLSEQISVISEIFLVQMLFYEWSQKNPNLISHCPGWVLSQSSAVTTSDPTKIFNLSELQILPFKERFNNKKGEKKLNSVSLSFTHVYIHPWKNQHFSF